MSINSEENDDGNGSDWEEIVDENDIGGPIKCLFCTTVHKSCEEIFDHCKNAHDFDIAHFKTELNLDCFSFICFINYLRKEKPLPESLHHDKQQLMLAITSDVYLKPAIEDDPLLMFDIDGLVDAPDCVIAVSSISNAPRQYEAVPPSDYYNLLKQLQETEVKLRKTEEQLEFASEQIEKMKSVVLQGMDCGDSTYVGQNEASTVCSNGEGDEYFSSYAHFGIHLEMLQDTIRTLSYRDAMYNNRELFQGKTVLDVGCGTGILSMFAARSGAAMVFGVDQSEIIYRAMDIVRENHLEDRITLLKGRMEDVSLPSVPVDIIVSEWMGYFLLFECMIDTVVYAREKYLARGGILLPNRCTINIAGICDVGAHANLVSFWNDVFGFKMSCLRNEVTLEANVEVVKGDTLITEPQLVHDLDLMACTAADAQFSKTFQLKAVCDGPLTAIVGWFDSYFDLPNKISFSTSPLSEATHWKQTVFYLQKPLPVTKGTVIDGKISCSRSLKLQRALKIRLTLNGVHFSYIVQ